MSYCWRLLLLTLVDCSCRQHHQEKFGTERHFQKIYIHRSRPKQCAALDLQTGVTMNSAQKHNFHTSSSLKEQVFREQVRDNPEFSRIHGREFPISRLLCRKREVSPGIPFISRMPALTFLSSLQQRKEKSL